MKVKPFDILYFSILFIIPFIYYSFNSLNVDTVWGLYSGENIINGFSMYVDIVDVNPPLIFIYFTVVAFFSKLLNISTSTGIIVFIELLILISITLSYKILSNLDFKNTNFLRYYLYFIALTLTLLISYNFAEREHLFVIFILPYVLMMIYKNEIKTNQKSLKIFIALFAVLGFNLKPHFFLLFVCLEICFLLYKKDIFTIFRIETILIALSAFVYLFVIFYFYPEYINEVIPLSIETYTNLFNKPFDVLVLNLESILFFISVVLFLAFTKNRFSYSNIAILLAVISTLIIYLAQQKGWSYHRLPFFVFTLLFLAHLIFYRFNPNSKYFIVLLPLICFIPYFNLSINTNPYIKLENLTNTLPKRSVIQIVTIDIAQGQPLLKKTQTWASKYPSLFMLPALINKENKKIEKKVFNSIYEDLITYKPDYIIFPKGNRSFNYYDYFITKDKRIISYYNKYYKKITKKDFLILKAKVNK